MCKLLSLDDLNRFTIGCSVKRGVLKKLYKFHRKASNFGKKETPRQMFSCEIWEILNNTYIQKYLLTTVSDFPNPAYSFSYLISKFYPFQYQQSTD